MSYALQLVRERKERLARMESRAWSPPPKEEPAKPEIVSGPTAEELTEQAITRALETARHIKVAYGDLAGGKPPIRPEHIMKVVAAFYGMSPHELMAQRRTLAVVRPRQVAMYLSVHLTLHSLPEIGRRYGGRDHTTVLHSAKKIEQLMANDADLLSMVDRIECRLRDVYEIPHEPGEGRCDPRTAWNPEMDAELRQQWGVVSRKDIATDMGISAAAVYRRAMRLGLPAMPVGHPGA
jgi:hypothetical protein